MKVRDILEAPYWFPGSLKDFNPDGKIHRSEIAKSYISIGSLFIKNTTVGFFISSSRHRVIGVCRSLTTLNVYDIVFELELRPKHQLTFPNNFPNVIQEKRLITRGLKVGAGVATYAYQLLLKRNFTIVSDDAHFDDATHFWTRLSAKSDGSYIIVLVDAETGLIRDKNKKLVTLDSSNQTLRDFIWGQESDMNNGYKLLIAVNPRYVKHPI